ncbi:MAG: lamin tail domain-containing protein [Candidatus Moranbacteria bacterium]|nr:lamin tail domain-containing protein [Candidatus Moranbacteria bacterium]
MYKSFYKKIIFLQAIFLMGGFLFTQNVQAGYSDTDFFPDKENKISASSLDLEMVTSESFSEINLLLGENVSVENVVKNVGGIDSKYKIDLSVSENENDVCDSLELEITNDSGQIYSGILMDTISDVVELSASDSDNLSFVVSLPDTTSSSVELSECVFDINLTAWQIGFDESTQGWTDVEVISGSSIMTGEWSILDAPVQTGYNENDESDSSSYPTPHSPDSNELSCVNGVTNINGISVHWTDVSDGDVNIKYQRQYKVGLSGGWSGNEIYTNPYTNYRTFGGSSGNEGIYGSRVRAWRDLNGNNSVDAEEKVSDWSNECYITFDKTDTIISDIDYKNISVTIAGENKDGIEITWTTNELATSKVVYGVKSGGPYISITDYPKQSDDDLTADNVNHSVILTDFDEGENEDYYYRVISVDQAGNEVVSEEKEFGVLGNETGIIEVVMNEFMPNPDSSLVEYADNDNQLKGLDGEWIELYNAGDIEINLAGFYLKDDALVDPNIVIITTDNTNTGLTTIEPNGYLVIYSTGADMISDFGMNNDDGDTISFYNPTDNLLDSYTYTETINGKTYARFPDGGVWVDPKPTPGEENEFTKDELKFFQEIVLEECFEDNKLIENEEQSLCSPIFVDYIGLIDGIDSVDLKDKFIEESDEEEKEKESEKEEKDKKLLNDFQINKVEIPNEDKQVIIPTVTVDISDKDVKENPEENIDDTVVEVDKNNSDIINDEKDAKSDKISGEKSEKLEQEDSEIIDPVEKDNAESPVIVEVHIVKESDILEKDDVDIENEDKEEDAQVPSSENVEEDYEEIQGK